MEKRKGGRFNVWSLYLYILKDPYSAHFHMPSTYLDWNETKALSPGWGCYYEHGRDVGAFYDITRSLFPELGRLAHTFQKVERAREVKDGLYSFLGEFIGRLETRIIIRKEINFAYYGTF